MTDLRGCIAVIANDVALCLSYCRSAFSNKYEAASACLDTGDIEAL
jgi:hypothetical protein